MKKIMLWIGGGILFVAVAFFLPGYSGDIWSAVILGSIAAFLYLIAFTIIWVKKINSPAKRKGIISVLVVLVLGCSVFGMISYEDSQRQRQILKDIRFTIESNISYNYVHEPLLKTFRLYYTTTAEQNMAAIFRTEFDSLITEGGIYKYKDKEKSESPTIHIAEMNADRIVLVWVSKYVDGKDSEFKNYSGTNGQYQVKATLTSKGIHYEREN